MSWKEFLKPNWRKILIFIVFILLSYFYVGASIAIIDGRDAWDYRGLPFMYLICEYEYEVATGYKLKACDIVYLHLIINLLFWYLISCSIVWIYDKYIKKVKKRK